MNIHIARPGSWSDVEDALLTQKWTAGYSASLIAKELPGKTKNAVISAVHRLKLPSRPTRFAAGLHQSYPAQARKEPAPRVRGYRKAKEIERAKYWLPLPDTTPITMDVCTSKQCKWPLDLPHEIGQAFVCGQPVFKGKVYCGSHCRVAYEPRKKSS